MSEPTDWNQPPHMQVPPPGPRSRRLAVRLAGVESRNVTYLADDFPIFWEKSRGSNVWDADGNRYVDLTGGFGVAVAGHRNRRVMQAIRRQIGRLPHGMGDVHPPALKVKLLEALAAVSPDPRSPDRPDLFRGRGGGSGAQDRAPRQREAGRDRVRRGVSTD